VEAGHRSIVIACEGSSVRGELHAIESASGVIDDATRERTHAAVRSAIANVIARTAIDVIHLHGIDFAKYLPQEGPRVLATLHLPPSWYPRDAIAPTRPRTWVHCVSREQAAACPPSDRLLEPIENGVEVERFAMRPRWRRGVVALGRICPEKGFHFALDAAHRADVALTLGGAVFGYDAHVRYFREEIRPRLDARRRFVGPLRFRRKRRLLASSCCLLAPSVAPETSSLVAMEAIASGTPVVAYRAGALPSIVEDGVTGFVVDDAVQMAAAIRACEGLDSARCRQVARERFSARRMTDRYLALYARLRDEG
jgi:glycosyltransferase involved in cell wall biosynthesis